MQEVCSLNNDTRQIRCVEISAKQKIQLQKRAYVGKPRYNFFDVSLRKLCF